MTEEAWMQSAACAETDPDLFFAEKGRDDLTRMAKSICAGCDVQVQCLEFALPRPEIFGVWGGTSDRKRREMRNRKPAA